MPIYTKNLGWVLETANLGYAIGLDAHGLLANRYWGARLPYPEDYPPPADPRAWPFHNTAHLTNEEFPAYAGPKYIDPCLKVTFFDGVRDTLLNYFSAEIKDLKGVQELILTLNDAYYPLQVKLHYRCHVEHDLIERWAEVENLGDHPITIERAFSAQWHFPRGSQYRLSHLAGRWLDETHLHREILHPGKLVLESRRLTTSHNANPWFALDRGSATEEQGDVWFGVLAWSGNWKLVAETTDFSSTRLSLGVNDWDFAWRLEGGQTYSTPSSIAGYTPQGFGAASRILHNFVRDRLLPHGHTLHKVLYNSWEATTFKVDEPSQVQLAEIAVKMGIELFVLDDGWFQKRDLDNAGLGDWWPDEVKFPNGLGGLIKAVNGLGMQFGLWVEPEMVNPDSDLYRAHSDWVIHFPTRPRSEIRQQLILNFARPDVQEYIIGMLDKLLTDNNIAFIKWDMNRNVSEPGWPDAPGEARELWVRYVYGVYRVWQTLSDRHPQVIWQSCSGGGGRADLGILRVADQVWTSDNTEATARLSIQDGFSQVFPANVMEAWVTDAGRGLVPLEVRFHVSMCGSLGVGGNLLHWDKSERDLAASLIAQYKAIRPLVQLGDQYRLISPQEHAYSAVQYVDKAKTESALFVFRTFIPDPAQLPQIYLRGLDLRSRYEVEGYGVRSGAAWMSAGLFVPLKNLESKLVRIRKTE